MFSTYVTLPHTQETVTLTHHNAEQVKSELKEAKDELKKVVAEKDKAIETLKKENHRLAEKVEQEEKELQACQVTRTHEDESCRENMGELEKDMRKLEKDKEKIIEDLKLDESNSVLVTIYQSGNTVDEELGDDAFIYKSQADDTILDVKRAFDERLLGGQHKENVSSAVSLYANPRAKKNEQLDDNIQLSTLVTDRRVTLWVRMYER